MKNKCMVFDQRIQKIKISNTLDVMVDVGTRRRRDELECIYCGSRVRTRGTAVFHPFFVAKILYSGSTSEDLFSRPWTGDYFH